MKQASLKALGAAVVGAAIAVGAAGPAAAGTLESVTTTATGAAKGLPLEQVAPAAPMGGPALVASDRLIRSGVLEQSAKAADTALAPHLPTEKLTGHAEKLAGHPREATAEANTGKPAAAPADNKGNAGLLGGLPTKAIAPNGLSLPGLGTPNIK
ncbi:hypothetical protein EKH77_19955 [Streptomyces luteoverticillatus]|uniref:ATP-binding protein n=1 Tax=Streptomyces luteoverticillatus TaxID=66425 RepID=A0A3Q9G0D5_STRLT|nr:hypothetical protein [Streptomyces luteoverticillatus]AZQ73181.1 hypothetical protein EKH77_19955 [Streptomyces luteoverticillatus]